MLRKATARWQGGLQDGRGSLSTESSVLNNIPFNFNMRFKNEAGTNPEELVAAAHAACFSMALANELADNGIKPTTIDTSASVKLDKEGPQWTVTHVHLTTRVQASEKDYETIKKIAEHTKDSCPISRLLKAPISLEVATK